MAKEKKYFMAGTDEEVLLGDVISQTLVKDFGDGRKIEREVEFKLTEDTVPYALEMGIIEETEDEKEEKEEELLDLADDENKCPYEEAIQGIIESYEKLEKRVEALEKASKTTSSKKK